MIGMRFEGGIELAQALNTLAVKASANVMRGALYDGGEPIRAHAERIAPRKPGKPDIAENIGMSAMRAREGEMAAIRIGPTKPGFAYGLPLEIGTRKMSAHPFMRPAFDAQGGKALGIIGQALWRELAARGVQRRASVPARIGADAFQEFA